MGIVPIDLTCPFHAGVSVVFHHGDYNNVIDNDISIDTDNVIVVIDDVPVSCNGILPSHVIMLLSFRLAAIA